MAFKIKKSAIYKKGFRDAYNNPIRAKEDANRFLQSGKSFETKKGEEYFNGKVDGVFAREKAIREGKDGFIWDEKELDEAISKV